MIDIDMKEYWCYRCAGIMQKEFCDNCSKKTAFADMKNYCQKLEYKVGDKVKFVDEQRPYTIKACNERFIIATKPYNPKRTFMYTIIDFQHLVRGADNYCCLYEYDKEEEAQKALQKLMGKNWDTDLHVSYRRFKKLIDIEIIKGGSK